MHKHFMMIIYMIVFSFCKQIQLQAKNKITISWNECVNEALHNNIDLQIAQENIHSSEYLTNSSKNGFYPQVSARLAYVYNNFVNPDGLTIYSASLSATQNLFSGFQDDSKIKQAKINEKTAQIAYDIAKLKLMFDLKSSFANLSFAQNSLNLNQEIIVRRENNLQLVQLRFENGSENKGSVLLSKAYLAQAKLDKMQAGDSIETEQKQLAKILGRNDEDDDIFVSGNVGSVYQANNSNSNNNSNNDNYNKLDFKEIMLKTNDYKQAVVQEESAQTSFSLVNAPFYPSLNLTGSIGKEGPQFFPQIDKWSVGLELVYPLFTGGKDYYVLQSSAALLRSSSLNKKNVDKQVLVNLQQSFKMFMESVEKLNVDQLFYEAAFIRSQIAREKYNNGLISFDDWDNIENDLIQREKNRLQSQKDRILKEAAWEQASCQGVTK